MNAAAVAAQAGFAAALLDPSCAVPQGLRVWNGSDPARRFAVHRNNVVVSLVDALADTFPVVRAQVGAEFFAAMARRFVVARPPASPVLAHYGDELADWLAAFEPARVLPHLPDLARLERARVRACHAADRAALAAPAVAARLAHPQRLPSACVDCHPSLQVLSSRWAVASLWSAHQQADLDAALAAVALDRPESVLVLRDSADQVLVLPVGAGEAAFVAALADGQTLGEALARAEVAIGRPGRDPCDPGDPGETAAEAIDGPAFDLVALLALLLRHGALVAWRDGDGGDHGNVGP